MAQNRTIHNKKNRKRKSILEKVSGIWKDKNVTLHKIRLLAWQREK